MLNDPMGSLKLRFLERCREELAALESIARRPIDIHEDGHERLIKIAHALAGAGGTFGFKSISEHSSRLEEALLAGAEPAEIRSSLDALILELRRVAG